MDVKVVPFGRRKNQFAGLVGLTTSETPSWRSRSGKLSVCTLAGGLTRAGGPGFTVGCGESVSLLSWVASFISVARLRAVNGSLEAPRLVTRREQVHAQQRQHVVTQAAVGEGVAGK